MRNPLKDKLAGGSPVIGLWCSLASPLATELVAGAGFDWIVIDTEHAPNDLLSVVSQLQACGGYDVEPMVRLHCHDPHLIKQYLDAGARSLVIPNVSTVAEAEALVRATRYPPEGMRGYAGAPRANRFGRVAGFHANVKAMQFLVLQIENPEAVANAEAIAAVDGVDCIFVGPADLAATMGHLGDMGAEPVQAAIREVVAAAGRGGAAPGILASSAEEAERYLGYGMTVVGAGVEVGLLRNAADALARRIRHAAAS
jgi:4-hydroxy-2-oxoheptanedioate aldolase